MTHAIRCLTRRAVSGLSLQIDDSAFLIAGASISSIGVAPSVGKA
ncbi:MAG TPA: hypothetical protein VNH64_04475 [Parvularculaceae bacterium]|nr:hypothetical protein [Parvularculaceae bacterium]